MRKYLSSAVCGAIFFFFNPCFAQNSNRSTYAQVYILGAGYKSCAHWTEQYDLSIQGWIAGYWSGLNQFGENHAVGSKTDYYGVIGEVRLECRNHPSESIEDATTNTFNLLRKTGR